MRNAAQRHRGLDLLSGHNRRLTVGAQTPDEVRTQLRWIAGLARRLGASVPGHAAGAFRQLAGRLGDQLPVSAHGDVPAGGH